jgi:signal transduction histidine kinase
VLAAALLAAALPRRLLRPLRALEDAVSAFAQGRLDHRIAPPREIEFARIADQLHAMAGEIATRRDQEQMFRATLETAIEARTAALRDALEDVEASEAARRELLADIGHELRTPLTVIRGEAQVALRDREAGAAAYRDSLGKIAAAAAQAGRLIDDLFAMSAARAAALSMTMAPVDLRDIVRDAVPAIAGAAASGGGVRVELPDAPVMATADAGRLRQVVGILLDNGLRYGASAQGVRVAVRRVEGGAEVTVGDRGPGLDPAEAARAFERGWRGADAQRRRPDGHGLGLPIAAGIADRHGGRLTLENRPGGGALARLFLPAAR